MGLAPLCRHHRDVQGCGGKAGVEERPPLLEDIVLAVANRSAVLQGRRPEVFPTLRLHVRALEHGGVHPSVHTIEFRPEVWRQRWQGAPSRGGVHGRVPEDGCYRSGGLGGARLDLPRGCLGWGCDCRQQRASVGVGLPDAGKHQGGAWSAVLGLTAAELDESSWWQRHLAGRQEGRLRRCCGRRCANPESGGRGAPQEFVLKHHATTQFIVGGVIVSRRVRAMQ